MRRAIGLAQKGIDLNSGGPFGAVIVKAGKIVGEGCNQVTSTNDPTAHAEVVAMQIKTVNLLREEGQKVFKNWENKADRTEY